MRSAEANNGDIYTDEPARRHRRPQRERCSLRPAGHGRSSRWRRHRACDSVARSISTTAKPSATQALDVLKQLGIEHARVAIDDDGALPFVISARIEAAARRAGLAAGQHALPEPDRAARRLLRKIACAVRASIFPAASQNTLSMPRCTGQTRSSSISKIPCTPPKRTRRASSCVTRCARLTSAPASAWCASTNCRSGFADLDEIIPEAPDLILVPKVETAAQIDEGRSPYPRSSNRGTRVQSPSGSCRFSNPRWASRMHSPLPRPATASAPSPSVSKITPPISAS